jgi:hypothetical protein
MLKCSMTLQSCKFQKPTPNIHYFLGLEGVHSIRARKVTVNSVADNEICYDPQAQWSSVNTCMATVCKNYNKSITGRMF